MQDASASTREQCSPSGATAACSDVVSNDNGVVICVEGTKTCDDGIWSACKANAFRALHRRDGPAQATMASSGRPAGWMDESPAALEIVSDVLRRFSRDVAGPDDTSVTVHPLSAGLAERLERKEDGIHAVVERRGATQGAEVLLPATADGWSHVTEHSSGMSVRFRMLGAAAAEASVAQKLVVYPGAIGAGHAIYRVTPAGVEDFVLMPAPRGASRLRYRVDVSAVRGLRLFANVLEMLDAAGTPRLRIAPPHVFDSAGVVRAATLTLSGCAADTSPAAPWGRPVTAPGASQCEIQVAWSDAGMSYPVLVDPSWVATGSMVEMRYSNRSTLLASGQVLDTGGFDTSIGAPTQTCELYDPTTGTWATTGALAQARYLHTASSLSNGKVLVAGGDGGAGALASAEIYDPVAGTFSAAPSTMSSAHAAHSATTLSSGLVLLAGGYDATGSATAVAEVFDASTNQFTTVQPLGTAREYHRASLVAGGKVLVTGGLSGGTPTASAELFDPTSQSFSSTGSMGTARAYHAVATLTGGNVLVTGGQDASGNVLSSAEVYSPTTGTFSATGSLTTPRQYHAATTLQSGQVLLTGGYDGSTWQTLTGIYDPTGGTFSPYVPMGTQRGKHTATVLTNGQVLAAGGENSGGSTDNAEVLTLVPAGSPCSSNSDCASNSCDDGICCSTACGGTCLTCTPGTGACVPVIDAPDPDTCSGANACNGLGQCVPASTICTNDPCDPTCATFPVDDGGLGGEASLVDGGGSWQGVTFGAGGAVNPGFTSKGIHECGQSGNGSSACSQWQYGEFNACQFDTYCVPGSCSADGGTAGMCLQYQQGQTVGSAIPGASCSGVDLTLGVACTDSSGNYQIPICNRGSTTLTAGTPITLSFAGGASTGIRGSPQCTDLAAALSVTCAVAAPAGGLAPGQCFDLTTASPGAGGHASCAGNLRSGNQSVFVNPDMSITECNLSPEPAGAYTSGGGCDDNWTDLHKPGGSCSTIGVAYQTIVYTQQYVASCPAGYAVQWGTFTYDTVQQSDSSGSTSVLFTAQTAALAADGGVGTFGASHVVADPPNPGFDSPSADPAECDLAANCVVNLYKQLGALDAVKAALELTITLNPTPDKEAAPTVLSWNLQYSCVASE